LPEVLILNTDDCCYGVLRVSRARRLAAAGASTTWAVIAAGIHLFPFRTEKLSPPAPMVLGAQAPGRVGRRPVFPQIGNLPAQVPDRERQRRSQRPTDRTRSPRLPCIMELRDGDLLLRPWTEDDVDALVAGCNDPEIAWWIPTIPHPYTEEDARAFLRGEAVPAHTALAIELDGHVVGGIGMGLNSHEYRATMGYWMAAGMRGRGICTQALRLLSRHALDDLTMQRVDLVTDPDNLASQRVAEKVGFRREGVLRAHLRHPDGRIRDSVMFSLLPGELRE
jgi:RimJ/RimL family protein N-acetyltransferase